MLELIPPGLAGLDLAHYRVLLPLRHEERDAFSPWTAFLPGGADMAETLRSMDLYELRHAANEAEVDMSGWDSARGSVSGEFVARLGDALRQFVPPDDIWTLLRWQGYKPELLSETGVAVGGFDYVQQTMGLAGMLDSIAELGMPEFLWCSTRRFGWGSPLYPDWGVITLSVEHYIKHFTPRGFESFYVLPDAELPDNLGD